MKIVKSTLWLLGISAGMLLAATPAHARGSVYVDIPGLSIGYYDHGYDRYRYKHRSHHGSRYYDRHDRYYSKKYRHYDHKYRDRNRGGYYNDYRYNDYYSDPYRYRQSNSYCPDPGYSRYRIERSHCYRHKDHYHCE